MNKQVFTCQNCKREFYLSDKQQYFYKKSGWELPKRCPHCRTLKRKLMQKAAELRDFAQEVSINDSHAIPFLKKQLGKDD